jgi:hypothetical protein
MTLTPGVAALAELGFAVTVLDWVDDCGPTVWIKARITSELDENRFLDWMSSVVRPLGGDVVEASLANPQQAA